MLKHLRSRFKDPSRYLTFGRETKAKDTKFFMSIPIKRVLGKREVFYGDVLGDNFFIGKVLRELLFSLSEIS